MDSPSSAKTKGLLRKPKFSLLLPLSGEKGFLSPRKRALALWGTGHGTWDTGYGNFVGLILVIWKPIRKNFPGSKFCAEDGRIREKFTFLMINCLHTIVYHFMGPIMERFVTSFEAINTFSLATFLERMPESRGADWDRIGDIKWSLESDMPSVVKRPLRELSR
jgi:hypothetical protein